MSEFVEILKSFNSSLFNATKNFDTLLTLFDIHLNKNLGGVKETKGELFCCQGVGIQKYMQSAKTFSRPS